MTRRPGRIHRVTAAFGVAAVAVALLGGCSSPAPVASTPLSSEVVLLEVADRADSAVADPTCRHSIFSAIDRLAVATALAGTPAAEASGYEPAYSMSPPGIASFDPAYRHLPVGDGRGDVAAARQALADCGHPDGLTVGLSSPTGYAPVADALRASLARAGIMVEDADSGSADLTLRTYQPNGPGVAGFWRPLAKAAGLPAVDLLLASPEASSDDQGMQGELGRMIDRLVLESGHFIPLAHRQE